MIKTIVFLTKLVVIAFVALMFSSCRYDVHLNDNDIKGSGNIKSETRTIAEDFNGIAVDNAIEVIIEQSDDKSIVVEADDNLLSNITTRVENGILKINSESGHSTNTTPKVTIKMPIIMKLNSSGSSKIRSINTIICDNLEAIAESSGSIEINVEADTISLETESAGYIKASGKALKLETASSSGSELDAKKLMANEVIAQSNSGSSTTVYPIVSLDASASTGSSIIYLKVPKSLKKESHSGGNVGEQ